MTRRAVITGIGVISPIGIDLVSLWEALLQKRSGVGPLQSYDASHLPIRFGGEVLSSFNARDYLEKKDRKRLSIMVRVIQFGVAAAQLALQDAGIDKSRLDPTRFGVACGVATVPSELKDLGPAALASCMPGDEFVDLRLWGEAGISVIPPMWMLSHIPNMMASHISIMHNAQGPNNTLTSTDLASVLALGEARRHIAMDHADILIVGGADTLITPVHFIRRLLFDPLSRRNDEPSSACRPFDKTRDGKVLSEGGGMMILEDLDYAQARGARIYAEIAGYGAAFDKNLSGRGLERAIRIALGQAGIGTGDIDHINAQGNSTQAGDSWEAQTYRRVFGPEMPTVLASKSNFGHIGAGSPAVELACSLLAMENGILPPTINFRVPDPACPVPIATEQKPVRKPYFLKVSLTEMGQAAAVVCRKWER